MIRSFQHKGLSELFQKGRTPKIDSKMHDRCLERLDALNAATNPGQMNVPGFDFHGLRGKPKRYSVHVNGPWCITFEFEDGDAFRVDFVNYH